MHLNKVLPIKRIAGFLLLALAFSVTGCSNLTEEELAQLNFIAEEALAEVSEEPEDVADLAASKAATNPAAAQNTSQAASLAGPKNVTNGDKTRRSVAAAVISKVPVASQQGADASVWQARALIDALNLDPQDRNTCFRVLKRSFFNRCADIVSLDACQAGLCYRYQVPIGGDLTIAHDYDSLTPIFLSDETRDVQPAPATNTQVASLQAKPQQGAPKASSKAAVKTPAAATTKPKASQLTKAVAAPSTSATATPTSTPAAQQQAALPAAPKPLRGVPQGIQPEPEGSDLSSTEFFTQGDFPLTF